VGLRNLSTASKVAEVADLHLQLRPGTDAFLLAAVLAMILRRGSEAAEFLAQRTAGLVDAGIRKDLRLDALTALLPRTPVLEQPNTPSRALD